MERIQKTLQALERNNITAHYARDRQQALEIARSFLSEGCAVAVGGSVTLRETGIQWMIENGAYRYTSRYRKGTFLFDGELDPQTLRQSYLDAYSADVYFTGANALTEEGELMYVDGQGNRISAVTFGPAKVVNVVGINKLVQDRAAGFQRIYTVAAPANSRRYDRATPCVKLGRCVQCKSPQRGCSDYLIVSHQRQKGRMHVILINEILGF